MVMVIELNTKYKHFPRPFMSQVLKVTLIIGFDQSPSIAH